MSVFVIAEAGVNHNGSLDIARELIDVAAKSGADAVKFQTFKADKVAVATAPKADYQVTSTGGADSQLEMIRKLELGEDAFVALAEHARAAGIEFLSTPFDAESAAFLSQRLGVARMKIPSGEITNAPLLLAIAGLRRPMILSTGMSTLDEIEAALGVLAFALAGAGQPSPAAFAEAYAASDLSDMVTLLHCTTEYPAPFAEVNLHAMDTMARHFGLAVGYSDHTSGIAVALAAAARGAVCVEKHFTLDRALPGPDHAASLEPGELADMAAGIRAVEAALGSPEKVPAPSESKNLAIARRSLVAARDIAAGDVISADALTAKRPGSGLSPMLYWDVLGSRAKRAYAKDEAIES
ncbi:MAG TPA: N-acetylneuraminate synthase [Alphaproteobacteria bacterium]|nr:N-acetylneuraminate synthase [Alphaproteobacteria bacterium]